MKSNNIVLLFRCVITTVVKQTLLRFPFYRSKLSFIVLFLLFISVFPWYIQSFQFSKEEFLLPNNSKVTNIHRIFPKLLFEFVSYTKDHISMQDNIVFISRDGKEESDYFLISYLLFPAKVFWISEKDKLYPSWWEKQDLNTNTINLFMRKHSVKYAILENQLYFEKLLKECTLEFQKGKYSLQSC